MKNTLLKLTMAAVIAASALNAYSADTPAAATAPAVLPCKGTAQHPFLYAGEWDTRKPQEQSIFIVRDGKVVWQYTMPLRTASGGNQEFDDATLFSNGNIIFSKMSGAGMVSPDKKLVWEYPAPPGTEIHSCQSIGKDRVLIMRNGNPAQAMTPDKKVVWALSAWKDPDLGPSTSIQLLDEPGALEDQER